MDFYYPIPQIETESRTTYDCSKCGILEKKRLHHPRFSPAIGDEYDGFVIIPTNPTIEEDAKGSIFTSNVATQLRSVAYRAGFNLVHKAAILPAIRCAVGRPTDVQAQCCFPELDAQLQQLKPKVIIPIGDIPFKVLMRNTNKVSNTTIRNRIIPNYYYNSIVFPIWNINDIQGQGQKHITDSCLWDFQRIIGLYQKRFKSRKKVDEFLNARKILTNVSIRELKSIREIDMMVEELSRIRQFSYDYESTNVYPYDEDFEVITMSFGLEKSAWIIHEDMWKNNPNYKAHIFHKVSTLLTNPNVKKIIQNSKFEDLASRFILGIRWIENMECTMLASHVIDERPGSTSLDFQNLVRFGIPPYNAKVKQYLEAPPGSRVNRIRECNKDDLIEYTGLDAITTYNNWKVIDESLFGQYPQARENYEMLRKGHWTYGNMQQRGITLSESEIQSVEQQLNTAADSILAQIQALPEFLAFNEYMKTKKTKQPKDKQSTLNKLEERINGGRKPIDRTAGIARSGVAPANNPSDGSGVSQSIRDRIAKLRRTVTFT